MGTCTCTRRDFPDSPFNPQESQQTRLESSLGISAHTVTNLVTGLQEIATRGSISKARLQVYARIYELNLGLEEGAETPRGKLMRAFERRDGFDKENLSDLMVLLGKGEDPLKADAMFWSRCKEQQLARSEVRSLLQSLTDLAYSALPQFALDSIRSTSPESAISALERDIIQLKSAQATVVAHWETKLMAGQESLTLTQFRSGFGEDECKALCGSTSLRQFGREVDKLLKTP